jgi:hypothetical protein
MQIDYAGNQLAGGNGSLMEAGFSGLLRRVRTPTTMGMAMKISARNKRMYPKYEGAISEYGLLKFDV